MCPLLRGERVGFLVAAAPADGGRSIRRPADRPAVCNRSHVIRIGDLALATNPFELFVDYGLRIKARSIAAQTVVSQITAGTGWYLPTERAVEGGSYGAMPAVCKVGPEGGRELVEVTLEMISELFS
jgi:hypothetical protein